MASPAEVLRQCLLDAKLVLMPEEPHKTLPYIQLPGDGTLLCYVSSMPDEPDGVLCIYDELGRIFGRSQPDGKTWFHHGLRLILRHLDYSAGYDTMVAMATAIETISRATPKVGDLTYAVDNAYRVGPVRSLGEEVGKRRQLFSLMARIVFAETQPNMG
jgi:hypothetical protein